MKTSRSVFLVILILFACGRTAAADPVARVLLTPAQIEQLVSPIALYPDPLVGLILPAATRPSDIVLAARFLERGGDPERAATEPWDESVKALTRYREVLTYLDENLAWTRSLGECFLDQPDAVMDAIQMVRVRARAAGLLTNTGEQAVIVESDEIRIVPANPTIIYVPRYSPEILYVTSFPFYYSGPFLTFGVGYSVGAWLNYDCDWRYRAVRIAHRPDHWYRQPDWREHHRDHPAGTTNWNRWVPPPRHDRRFDRPPRTAEPVLRPDRPRDWSDSSPHVTPSPRHRDIGRPVAEQNPFRPSAPAIAPEPRPSQPPAYQHSPAQAPAPRFRQDPPSNPRPNRDYSPAGRPAPAVQAPPPPRAIAPSFQPPPPAVQTRPPETRNDDSDRSTPRQRAESNDRRRPLN
jgi:hypothetical protein